MFTRGSAQKSERLQFVNEREDMLRGGEWTFNKLRAQLTGTDEGNPSASYRPSKLIEAVVMEPRSGVTCKRIDNIRSSKS